MIGLVPCFTDYHTRDYLYDDTARYDKRGFRLRKKAGEEEEVGVEELKQLTPHDTSEAFLEPS
jgi:hypothetical protein